MALSAPPFLVSAACQLSDVRRTGEWTIVDLTGPEPILGRLKSLGFCVGHCVRLVRRGDPAIVEVMGTRIGMSAAIAQYVRVRSKDDSSQAA